VRLTTLRISAETLLRQFKLPLRMQHRHLIHLLQTASPTLLQ